MQRVLTHFGEPMRHSPYGLRLTRETYSSPNDRRRSFTPPDPRLLPRQWEAEAAHFDDGDHRVYRASDAQWMHERAMRNFDLNMAFFRSLDPSEFEAAIMTLSAKHSWLKPVETLHGLDGKAGVYVLVLDRYRQVYIGQSLDIRRRIRQHWARRKPLDRLVFGSEETSVLSIDSFRAMDTTRILAGVTGSANHWEPRMVKSIPAQFLLNRIGGGTDLGAALARLNERELR